ncbi:recombinase family protein [Oceanobacillus kimchii]|uniref:DNA recombinase n=1 Tax=Oceanobacillus kimchii TaxID=746691 RepID=A0ABQ5TIJ2_9BACI|nr:recombinase family protein [Oceanobacillus kimchii]GLO66290.1 putative DNA recombinase [Oceanobacillus kimchii]
MITLKGGFEKFPSSKITELIDNIKGIVYVRVSTHDQSEKYSLDSQVDLCVELGKKKYQYTDDEFIVLIEAGEMGDNPNRPALNYAIELLEKGVGKKLFLLHPDRLSRYLNLQTQVSERVWNAGCDLEFVEIDLDPNNPESMLMFNIQGSIAQYNKAKILANSKRGRISKARKGQMSGLRRIYGYNFDKENDVLVVNEEEKEVFLDMVEMLLYKNMSCSRIAEELSLRNINAPNSDKWYQASVTRILQNESYTGNFYYGKTEVVQKNGKKKQVPKPKDEWILIKIPPLISYQTHLEIKEKIKQHTTRKSGRPSENYLLKNLAKCGRCGGACGGGIISKTSKGIIRYYACTNKNTRSYKVGTGEKENRCKGRNWRVDEVDEFVWNYILAWLKNPEQIIEEIFQENGDSEKIEAAKSKVKKLKESKDEQEKERKNYIKLFGSGMIRDEEELSEYLKPIDDKINYIEADIEIYQNIIDSYNMENDKKSRIADYLKSLKHAIISDDIVQSKKIEIVEMLVHRVLLHEDNTIEIVTKFSPTEEEYLYDLKHGNPNHRQTYGGSTSRFSAYFSWISI